MALSQSLPFGHRGLPLRYLKVVSSGATMPARAPASMVMLQTDILASNATGFTSLLDAYLIQLQERIITRVDELRSSCQ